MRLICRLYSTECAEFDIPYKAWPHGPFRMVKSVSVTRVLSLRRTRRNSNVVPPFIVWNSFSSWFESHVGFIIFSTGFFKTSVMHNWLLIIFWTISIFFFENNFGIIHVICLRNVDLLYLQLTFTESIYFVSQPQLLYRYWWQKFMILVTSSRCRWHSSHNYYQNTRFFHV